jgi:hypothetical protein
LNNIGYNGTTNGDLNHSAGVPAFYQDNWNVINSAPNVDSNNNNVYTTRTNADLIDGAGNPRDASGSPNYHKLVDSTNAATNISFSVTFDSNDHTGSANAFSYDHSGDQVTGSNADNWLANGSVFTQDTVNHPVALTISGLNPSDNYSLVAYVSSPWWGVYASPAPEGAFTVGGLTYYDTPVSGTNSTWVQGTSTDSSNASTGNYVQFDGLTGSSTQTLTVSGNLVGLGGFQVVDTTAPIPTWNVNASGDWNVISNWHGGIPNGIGKEADLQGAISTANTVYTNSNITLGTLNFNNSNTYVVTGAGALTMQTSTGLATIIVQAGTQKINLPLTIASSTNLNVSSGATLLIANPVEVLSGQTLASVGTGTVTYQSIVTVDSGASFSLASSTFARSLALVGSATAALTNSGGRKLLQLDGLSVGSGSLDLANNDLIVHGGSISAVTTQLASGYASGTWAGSGIRSTAAASDSTHLTALGSMAVALSGTIDGAAVTTGDVVVRYTYYGDASLDGSVNSADYAKIDNGYLGRLTGWQNGDFNYDGSVNGSDYTLIDNAFNTQGSPIGSASAQFASATAQIAGSASAVPEPTSLALLSLGAIGLLRRRTSRGQARAH